MNSRRQALGSLGALLSGFLHSTEGHASGRPSYGGRARLTLPIDTSRIDPHDPDDLPARLVGASLFDGLYGQPIGGGAAYATLASAPPAWRENGLAVELRPGLHSGRGVALDARAIVQSLERTRSRSPRLKHVQRIRATGPLELTFTTDLTDQQLTLELAALECAIVPPRFDPAWPDCTGALRSLGPGIQRLVRNESAPRGGSYLAEVNLTTGDLRSCLRDFEALTSDVGFLGSGLHHGRKSAHQFALGALGWLVLLPGERLGRFAAPGVLREALGALNHADFSALGVELVPGDARAGWTGPPCSILVDGAEPWLVAIATELARAWDSPRARVSSQPVAHSELERARRERNFDCALVYLGATAPDDVQGRLLDWAGLPAPKRPLGTVALEDGVRHLPLALLGQLTVRGFHGERLAGLTAPGALDLGNARFYPDSI